MVRTVVQRDLYVHHGEPSDYAVLHLFLNALVNRWDVFLEARRLDLPDAQDTRSGVMTGIYRHLGSHVKAGVGYNFSDFSDDLTQLDYRHQGMFINLVGKY